MTEEISKPKLPAPTHGRAAGGNCLLVDGGGIVVPEQMFIARTVQAAIRHSTHASIAGCRRSNGGAEGGMGAILGLGFDLGGRKDG